MDVEKLIEATKWCTTHQTCKGCVRCEPGKNFNFNCGYDKGFSAETINAVSLHYETLLASERSKVIAEVREWSKKTQLEMYGPLRQSVVLLSELNVKLDSMDKG